MSNKKTRISYSAADTFKTCPKKYWNQRTHRLAVEASAFSFGSAFENAVYELLSGKTFEQAYKTFKTEWHTKPGNRYESAKQIFDADFVFYYASDWDVTLLTDIDKKLLAQWYGEIFNLVGGIPDSAYKNIGNTVDDILKKMESEQVTPEERKFANRAMWLSCRRRGAYMVKAFERDILPQITKVISIQEDISIKNDDGDEVMGVIDLIVELKGIEGPVILDLKSAGRPYDEHKLDTSDQLGIYAVAKKVDYIGYAVVMKGVKFQTSCNSCGHIRENARKTNCEKCEDGKYTLKSHGRVDTQLLTRKISKKQIAEVAQDYTEVLTAVKNKINWRNPNSCNNFGTRCEYYEHCWGGKSLDELKNLKKK